MINFELQCIKAYCAVPENIHTPPMECFFSFCTPHPPGNSSSFIFPSKILMFNLEFLMTFLRVCMDFLWNYTLLCGTLQLLNISKNKFSYLVPILNFSYKGTREKLLEYQEKSRLGIYSYFS